MAEYPVVNVRALRGNVAVMCATAALAACGSDGGGRVIRVPADAETIQSAVDTAQPGDLVLIEPGVYNESVTISTDALTLRGTDRNGVVLDGRHELVNGVSVDSDGVAVENLTVHSFRQNGVLFNGASGEPPEIGGAYGAGDDALVGFRVAYVTAANNGLYGIYAFASRDGLVEHSLASGSPDSGLYIGQCRPCNIVIRDSIAENNAIGYYGTNASGDVYVVNSVFRHNRLGISPNSQDMEMLAPQVETFLAGNVVHDNDNPSAPATGGGFSSGGIAIGGGTQNVVVRNRVAGHEGFGIGLVRLNDFDPIGNRVEGNLLDDNAIDLYVERLPGTVSSFGNCFASNEFVSAMPADVERLLPCDGDAQQFGTTVLEPVEPAQDVDYRAIPLPDPQPTMPGDLTNVPTRANRPPFPNLDEITLPGTP